MQLILFGKHKKYDPVVVNYLIIRLLRFLVRVY